MATPISKKRQAVADGVFKAELNELLVRELAEDGYSGVEVRRTSTRTEIIIRATRTQKVLGEAPARPALRRCGPARAPPPRLQRRAGQQHGVESGSRRATLGGERQAAPAAATCPRTAGTGEGRAARTLTARARRREGPPHPRADVRGPEAV